MATIPGHLDQLEMELRSMRLNYKRGEMSIGDTILALVGITESLRAIKTQNDAVRQLVLASTTLHHVKEIEESYSRISEIADSVRVMTAQVGEDVVVLMAAKEMKSKVSA